MKTIRCWWLGIVLNSLGVPPSGGQKPRKRGTPNSKLRHYSFIEQLARFHINLIITVMKFALAILVYLLMGVVLGAGILLAVAGKPWFLIAAFIAYVVAFGKIGCMTH